MQQRYGARLENTMKLFNLFIGPYILPKFIKTTGIEIDVKWVQLALSILESTDENVWYTAEYGWKCMIYSR